MKKLLAAVCVAIAGLACGPAIELSDRPLFSNGTNTITYLVFDAFTGAEIQNASISLQLGAYTIEATQREGTNAYVAAQLPPGTHFTTVTAEGYLATVVQTPASSSGTLGSPANQRFETFSVRLYPATSVSQSIVVRAFDATTGQPISSGRLVAQLTGASGVGPTLQNELVGSITARPNVITSDFNAAGEATLAAESLVFGGRYSLDVFNTRNAAQVYLQTVTNYTLDVGDDLHLVTMFLSAPAESPRARFANNEDPAAVVQRLEVTFPFPVEVCSAAADHSWTGYGLDVDLDGNVATPAASNPVSTSVASNVLTVTPNYATPVDPQDGQWQVQFNGIRVRVVGASTCLPLQNVSLREGGWVSTLITIQAAP